MWIRDLDSVIFQRVPNYEQDVGSVLMPAVINSIDPKFHREIDATFTKPAKLTIPLTRRPCVLERRLRRLPGTALMSSSFGTTIQRPSYVSRMIARAVILTIVPASPPSNSTKSPTVA
ncbi:hypothetical protein GQR58_030147 [Nymphon striatum]|nr:hypothetical protein GQR58_030147 [Nymphon striatum]